MQQCSWGYSNIAALIEKPPFCVSLYIRIVHYKWKADLLKEEELVWV